MHCRRKDLWKIWPMPRSVNMENVIWSNTMQDINQFTECITEGKIHEKHDPCKDPCIWKMLCEVILCNIYTNSRNALPKERSVKNMTRAKILAYGNVMWSNTMQDINQFTECITEGKIREKYDPCKDPCRRKMLCKEILCKIYTNSRNALPKERSMKNVTPAKIRVYGKCYVK